MNELEQYIKSYFGIVHTQDLDTISSLFGSAQIKKGDFFLKVDQQCHHLSFIKSGILRLFLTIDGKEVTQWIATKGFFVTDLSGFIFETPARWNIQALTDVELYSINRDDYKNIPNLVPQWPTLEKLFIVKCFTMMEERILTHLSMTSEERYLLFFEQNKELFNQVPLQYIASMLGMTPETFSRIRKKRLSIK